MLTHYYFWIIIFAPLALLPAPCVAATKTPAEPAPPSWELLLNWLPENTETLIVAPNPFEIPKDKLEKLALSDSSSLLPASLPLGFREELLRAALSGQKVLCAMEGSRRFTTPRGLGMMPYEGAHILLFDLAADEALRKAFALCQEKADKKLEVAGQPVALISEKSEEDIWSFYITRPQPGVLIVATNQGFLEETLKRIGQKNEKRAFPAALPEWKQVDVKATVWGIRHFRKEFAKTDPTSPLRPKSDAASDVDAIGLVFWYNSEADKIARVRYLSDAANAIEIAKKNWHHPSEKLEPKIEKAGPGVIEISVSVAEEKSGHMFLFVLLAHIGHAICL